MCLRLGPGNQATAVDGRVLVVDLGTSSCESTLVALAGDPSTPAVLLAVQAASGAQRVSRLTGGGWEKRPILHAIRRE